MENLAKYMIYIGIFFAFSGFIMYIFGDYLGWLGKTPLDFSYKSDNVNIYFPLGSMIIISIILSEIGRASCRERVSR